MSRGMKLWYTFRGAFLTAVDALSSDDVQRLRTTERTIIYGLGKRGQDGLLPRLTPALGMVRFDQEYFRADGVYVKEGGWPEIFVESENDAQSAWREIERLCYVRAPLKVLITVTNGPYAELRSRWIEDIQQTNAWLPESADTVYGFLLLDLSQPIPTYASFAVGADGQCIEETARGAG